MLKLVPFNSAWVSHDKLDIKAIYRRPRFVEDRYGELMRELDAQNQPTWDITGPLPVRSHNRWLAKGFEYITLADRESLVAAFRFGTLLPEGAKAQDYDQHTTGGPWNYKRYVEGQETVVSDFMSTLEQDVNEFGAEVVEKLHRRQQPGFNLPPHLVGKAAGFLAAKALAEAESAPAAKRK